MRNVKQNFLYKTNIHSPQRPKREIFSCTQVCQVLLTLSNTCLVCTPHTATILPQKLDEVCFIPNKELWVCKWEPFWQQMRTLPTKISYREESGYSFLLHRHLGIGFFRNRFWHEVELKKKSTWFERTPAIIKNIQMPMREHNICKSEEASFFSKVYSGNCQSRQSLQLIWKESSVLPVQNIYLLTYRTVKKRLPNPENISTQCKMATHSS